MRQSIAGKSETRLADDILVSNALYPNIFTPVQTVGIGRQNLPTVQKWRHYVFFDIDLATEMFLSLDCLAKFGKLAIIGGASCGLRESSAQP